MLGICFALLCVLSSFAINSLGKRELVAFLLLCSECHVAGIVFFTLPCGSMSYVIVAFPGHTHLHVSVLLNY